MRLILMAFWSLFSLALMGQNSLSIMYYNLLNYPGTTAGRADTLRKILQYAPPDLLVVNELSSEEGADLILSQSLNVFGIDYYKRAAFTDGYDTDNMLFYNSTKVSLLDQYEIETELRLINEYNLFVGSPFSDTVFFSIYSAHLKASQGYDEENQRLAEVTAFKAHLAEKTSFQNIIFGGDLNLYGSNEPAYEAIMTAYDIFLHDPIFSPGQWHNNSSFANIHTQSTRVDQFGGGASGGIDDRFDIIFVSTDILSGANRIQYVKDSYITLGQDGDRFNQSLLDPPNYSAPDSVISALYYMSDHMPVMMQVDILDSASAVSDINKPHPFIVDYYICSGQMKLTSVNHTLGFKIFDLMGKEVYRSQIHKGDQSIQLPANLNHGIYLFYFQKENSKMVYLEKTLLFN